MAGLLGGDSPKERTCWECHFHDWNSDQCALGRRAGVIGDEPGCQSHMTDAEFDEDFTRRLEERRKRKREESDNGKQSNHDQTSSGA